MFCNLLVPTKFLDFSNIFHLTQRQLHKDTVCFTDISSQISILKFLLCSVIFWGKISNTSLKILAQQKSIFMCNTKNEQNNNDKICRLKDVVYFKYTFFPGRDEDILSDHILNYNEELEMMTG